MAVILADDRPRMEVVLADGSSATLSPLLPEDRGLLQEGMEHLSVEGRFSRFGQGLGGLTEHELDYLSNVDQVSHVAWGAIVDGEPAGIGRYIVGPDGEAAEVAITIIDAYQRRGLGRILFTALVAVARADGIGRLTFEVLTSNTAVMHMLRGLEAGLHQDGEMIAGEIEVGGLPPTPIEEPLVQVMREVRSSPRWGDAQPDSSRSSDAELMQ
jgi:GNAT superfamily N-acetyltransferase